MLRLINDLFFCVCTHLLVSVYYFKRTTPFMTAKYMEYISQNYEHKIKLALRIASELIWMYVLTLYCNKCIHGVQGAYRTQWTHSDASALCINAPNWNARNAFLHLVQMILMFHFKSANLYFVCRAYYGVQYVIFQ